MRVFQTVTCYYNMENNPVLLTEYWPELEFLAV